MALKDVEGKAEPARAVTPMAEIRRRKAISLADFERQHPDYEWSEWRRKKILYDDQGDAWVATVDPEHGLRYASFDEPELTPAVEAALSRLAKRALDEVRAGSGVVFDPDAPDDD